MSAARPVSDELLNAYVDGELAGEDLGRLLAALEGDPRLRERVGELHMLKDMVRHACTAPSATTPSAGGRARGRRTALYAAAAGIVIALSATALALRPADVLPPAPGAAAERSARAPAQVVFHLSSATHAGVDAVLDQVEAVLETYARGGRALRVEVVANNSGLDAYRVDRSRVAGKIRRLYARFPNVVFAACGRTLARMAEAAGTTPELLPEVVVVDSGVAEVSRRQAQGWLYIRT